MSPAHGVPTGLKAVLVAFRLQTCRSYGAKIRVNTHFSKSFRSTDNKLMTVPREIVRLQQLQHLNLSCNRMCAIPEFVFRELPNLQELRLSNNSRLSRKRLAALREKYPVVRLSRRWFY